MDGINWRSTNAFFAETTIAAAVADAGHPHLQILRHIGRKLCVGSPSAVGRECLPLTASSSRPSGADALP